MPVKVLRTLRDGGGSHGSCRVFAGYLIAAGLSRTQVRLNQARSLRGGAGGECGSRRDVPARKGCERDHLPDCAALMRGEIVLPR